MLTYVVHKHDNLGIHVIHQAQTDTIRPVTSSKMSYSNSTYVFSEQGTVVHNPSWVHSHGLIHLELIHALHLPSSMHV